MGVRWPAEGAVGDGCGGCGDQTGNTWYTQETSQKD